MLLTFVSDICRTLQEIISLKPRVCLQVYRRRKLDRNEKKEREPSKFKNIKTRGDFKNCGIKIYVFAKYTGSSHAKDCPNYG